MVPPAAAGGTAPLPLPLLSMAEGTPSACSRAAASGPVSAPSFRPASSGFRLAAVPAVAAGGRANQPRHISSAPGDAVLHCMGMTISMHTPPLTAVNPNRSQDKEVHRPESMQKRIGLMPL